MGGGGDIAADTGTLATIAVGGSVDSVVDVANDRDWFRVTLTAGQNYLFTTDWHRAAMRSATRWCG